MCMVSVLTGYGQSQVPATSWTPQSWEKFKGIHQQVEALDGALGEPECIDPEKQKWFDDMEARMQALEAAAFRAKP